MEIASIIQEITANYGIFIIIFFLIFLVIARFVAKLLFQLIFITILAAIFPIFMNKVFGLAIPLNIETIINFAALGAASLLIYYFLKILWKISEIVASTIEHIASYIEKIIHWATEKKEDRKKREQKEKKEEIELREENKEKEKKE